MCRFAAYLGTEIFISSLVTEPKHSIIHQSYHARERVEPLNGDGFGIGWYAPQFCESPALFKEVSPAWNNQNLRDIARVTKSSCIFAHVRAATVGSHLSRTNCHPFSWKQYLFMHNGTVFGFDRMKRRLQQELSDVAFGLLQGDTDTEHIFALFIDRIKEFPRPTVDDLADSLLGAISAVEAVKRSAGIEVPSTMNLVLSDGRRMVATRYVSAGSESNSLYFSRGERFTCEKGLCRMAEGEKALLVVSEPLNTTSVWEKIENNHLVFAEQGGELGVRQINI